MVLRLPQDSLVDLGGLTIMRGRMMVNLFGRESVVFVGGDNFKRSYFLIHASVAHLFQRSAQLQSPSKVNNLFVMPKLMNSPRAHRHNRSQQIDNERYTPRRSHTVQNQHKLKVFIKFKPEPRQPDPYDQVTYINHHELQIRTTLKHRIYQFDYVFSPKQGPKEVFDIGCRDILEQVFRETSEGSVANNGLVFVYGNTGTGKTYSMGLLDLMDDSKNGLVPDALRYLFGMLKRSSYESYSVSLSFCEIYMDEVYDLLALESEAKLFVREDSKTKEPFLQNQMLIQVQSPAQAFQIINIGLEKRRVAEQRMNRRSSRGHGVIGIHIDPNNGQRPGKLCFVDLAGCERLKDSESKGTTLTEALHINSSLSSLETLLMNISEQSIRNYRASKLTRLLQPFLERGKINLFVTTTKDSSGTIQFAKRCKGIRFMEKDLRQATTPLKKGVGDKSAAKWAEEVEELNEFKRAALEKEKKYVQCIAQLARCLSRVSVDLQQCLASEKFKAKYSFSEIMNNGELQEKINRKIQSFESKQHTMVQQLLVRLQETPLPQQLISPQMQTDQLLLLQQTARDYTQQLTQQLRGLSALNDYRSVYKKELFTSELKLHLLQQRCKAFEEKIHQLTPYMNTADKRVARRLKELGITIENNENQPHLRNRQVKREREREVIKRSPLDQQANQQESPEIKQQQQPSSVGSRPARRSAIFIDEM